MFSHNGFPGYARRFNPKCQYANLLSDSSPLHSCAFLIGTVMMLYQKHYPALLIMDVNSYK